MDEEFAEADYLPEVFNKKENSFTLNAGDNNQSFSIENGRENSIE